MLSVLIPVYNCDCFAFASELQQQATASKIDFEIIVMDDCSTHQYSGNKKIADLPHCKFIELSQNTGRSKIRNKLAETAKYNHLLFLDCDARVASGQFINSYLPFCNESNIVVCGGRIYEKTAPENQKFFFHWKYGSVREAISANSRKLLKTAFMSNNFLVSRDVYEKIQFDETITQYGHEDTLFGIELEQKNIPIIHIDNALYHTGLETADVYIAKNRKSMENLVVIAKKTDAALLSKHVKVARIALKIKQIRLIKLFSFGFDILHKIIEYNLKSKRPSLFLFDVYKLCYFCKIYSAKN